MTRIANALVTPTHPGRRNGLRMICFGLCVLALGACSILPERETLSLYHPEPTITTDPAWPQVKWQLRIARPYADDLHDSARILVRAQPGELQVYKGAAWTQPAPDLVLDTLLRAFADSGRVPGLARRGEGIDADYELLLDLRRFESDAVDRSATGARITLGARLIHNADNRVVASRVFDTHIPADAVDMTNIHQAFESGLENIATQLIGWTLEQGQRDTQGKR